MALDSRRASALLMITSIAVAACSNSGSARLEGKWRGVRADGVPPEAQSAANAFATGTEIEVAGDAIAIKTPKDKQAGKFKVVREDGKSVVILTDKDSPSDTQTFTFDNDKTMKWNVVDAKTITFVRQ